MFETWQQSFIAILTLFVFIAFVKEWLSAELVAMGALILCMIAGVLPLDPDSPYNALKVFSHPAPITVACMFIISAGLERTGVIEALGNLFEKLAGNTAKQMLVVMMILVILLSGFVNNTPVVVVFMPIVISLCRKREYAASRFLIPLSYAAIVGGTMTIIGTSTNLIAAGISAEQGYYFSMFEIMPLGIVFIVITVLYMLTLGPKLLPDRVTLATLIDPASQREFISHAFVKADSALDGTLFTESPLANMRKARVIEVLRDGVRLATPLKEMTFEAGDEVVFKGSLDGLLGISKTKGMDMRGQEEQQASLGLESLRTESALLMEGILGRNSSMVGKSLKEIGFRQKYGVIILAIHRRGKNLKERFEDEKLAFGDTLLVQGPAEQMRQLFDEKDFINLSEPKHTELRVNKAPIAIAALVLFVVASAIGGKFGLPQIPVVVLAMTGALMVLATRCVDTQEAYQAVSWKVIFMIFGMLGLGMAMEKTGLAQLIAGTVVETVGRDHPHLALAAFYLLAAVLTEIISNNAVAALLTPMAIIVGHQMGVSPSPFVVAVMFGSSASFSTPIGYQTNTFVYGAGGYKFGDFFRVGAPLAIILWITASFLIPKIWPF
ncbi:SLC13 family permease [Persicirhabdus sediminis]|uniref:SLC13 family permease n=1 Tax=Persicirhabdus sediminis TaxID=454144 RepID=A0A8J7MGW3_9BACT|nr:SLC13 family permease [Persicirhabdus sediminis]MBK1792622.1 SLC13 family permease [Persicirhabdus sediminis]